MRKNNLLNLLGFKRKLNRKAIMVDFLVTVLLAIIIFAPACYIASKFFRLSDQANNNFNDLAQEIRKFAKPDIKDNSRTFSLIMDKNTFVVLWDQDKIKSNNNIVNQFKEQCKEQACLCLCRTFEFKDSITCTNMICQSMNEVKFSHSWISMRRDEIERRIIVQLSKDNNNFINITGGNPIIID